MLSYLNPVSNLLIKSSQNPDLLFLTFSYKSHKVDIYGEAE